jgi:alkyl sulfatase BDS1-like metallo-beta-lactamase superfamily hydrolase
MSPADIKGQKPGGTRDECSPHDRDIGRRVRRQLAALSARVSIIQGRGTGDVSISGNPLKLRELFGLLDDFSPDFEIVEPRKVSVE